jgi:Protein of unknown function (DUF3800)
MYVDESGDTGMLPGSSPYFVLSGMVVHESSWQDCLSNLVAFRMRMRVKFGLKMREEIHSYEMITRPGNLSRIAKHERLSILRNFIDEIETLPGISVINVIVDKGTKSPTYDPFEKAWGTLIQRLDNTMKFGNFPHPSKPLPWETAILLPDQTNEKKLRNHVRRMRYYNPVPNTGLGITSGYGNLQIQYVTEDPLFKESGSSYFIQAVDCIAYMLYQSVAPNRYIRRQGGASYFNRLDTCLCKHASRTDPKGVVRL